MNKAKWLSPPSLQATARRLTVALLCATIPSLATCQARAPGTGPDEPTEAAQEPRPLLNPNPKQIVRIYGRLPEHLGFSLGAMYSATTEDRACEKNPGSSIGIGPLRSVTEPLEIRHDGDRFEATLVVDKYLPGPCGWKYVYSDGAVWRVANPRDTSFATFGLMVDIPLIDGRRYDISEDALQCGHLLAGCTRERALRLSNHDERIPILVRCRMTPPNESAGDKTTQAVFLCAFNDSHKMSHLVKPRTRQVRIDVYDLDVDPDPAPPPHKEK